MLFIARLDRDPSFRTTASLGIVMMTSDEIVSCSQVCFGVVPVFFCLFAISFGHQLLALFLLQTRDLLHRTTFM